jgi:hypothetical protein
MVDDVRRGDRVVVDQVVGLADVERRLLPLVEDERGVGLADRARS